MKKSNKEFWVEFDFIETEHGNRPKQIRSYRNKADAEAFVATTADGVVVEIEFIEW